MNSKCYLNIREEKVLSFSMSLKLQFDFQIAFERDTRMIDWIRAFYWKEMPSMIDFYE